MSRGQVLAVDFEKRELKGTQQNSDNDKQSFYRNKTKICNDAVTIFQTAKSGGIWHMRAYVGDADKYYQKSLRIKDKASAIDKATLEHAKLLVLKSEGKAIFSPTVYKAVEQYLQHRYDYDVQMDSITVGRWSTIRTHMNWFKRFVNAEYRLDNYTAKALMDYQRFRREKGAKDATIANEQSTINHFCKWAYDEGLHNITKYAFPKIKQRGEDTASIRRATFTDDEYKACYKELQTWCSKASKEKAVARLNEAALGSDERLFNRDLFRHWFLIQANTMMRNGELFGLKWKNVKTYEKNGKRLAEITVEAHTSKVRKSRVFVSRGGEHFDRLKQISKHTKKEDFVFTMDNGTHWNKHNRRALDYQFHKLMERVGIDDYKARNVSLYSLRHYGITQRLTNGVTNLTQFALDCGTSVNHITNTYYHSKIGNSEANALMMKKAQADKN